MVGKGSQLIRTADAVMVCVLPDLQVGKLAIVVVDDAVAILVDGGQGLKPGVAAEGEVFGEELGDVVDGPVAVHIKGKKTVITREPVDWGVITIGGHGELVECSRLHHLYAIAIQINYDWVYRYTIAGGSGKVTCGIGRIDLIGTICEPCCSKISIGVSCAD